MTERDRGAGPDERGFTLVELLFALMILAIVMVALAPAFYGMMKSTSASRQRSVADGLAVTAAEQIRSYPYWQVGYSTTPSYCPGSASAVPVTVTSSPMDALAPSSANPTANQQPVGGTTYTVDSCVYWQTASDGNGSAYKESVVTVQWGPSGRYSYTLTSALYPGAEGPYSCDPTTGVCGQQNFPPGQNDDSTSFGVPPAPVVNSASPVTGSTNSISVDWQPVTYPLPVEYFIEFWANTGPASQARPIDGSPLMLGGQQVGNGASDGTGGITGVVTTGLQPGGSYWFDVVAFSGSLNSLPSSTSVTATVNSPTAPVCSESITVAPNQITPGHNAVITNAGKPVGWTALTVTVGEANCSNLTVEYGANGANGHPSAPILVPLSGSGGTLTAAVTQTKWSATTYGFEVYVNGNPISPPSQANITPCVQQKSTGHC